MYCGYSEINKLIILIEDFDPEEDHNWKKINEKVQLFLVGPSSKRIKKIRRMLGKDRCIHLGESLSTAFNNEVPNLTGEPIDSMAIVVGSEISLRDIRSYPLGSIFLNPNEITKEYWGFLPDFRVSDWDEINEILDFNMVGWISEYQCLDSKLKGARTVSFILKTIREDFKYRVALGGRYIKKDDSRSILHPLSAKILANKKDGHLDYIFMPAFKSMIELIHEEIESIDSMTRVPPKPNQTDRFFRTVEQICKELNFNNLTNDFICTKNFSSQKGQLDYSKRLDNVQGKFEMKSDCHDQHIVVIDDVYSTGATALECARVLYEAGAKMVTFVALAVNQFDSPFRTNTYDLIECPNCGKSMKLRVNGVNKQCFYGCSNFPNCKGTMEYARGLKMNNKFNTEMFWSKYSDEDEVIF